MGLMAIGLAGAVALPTGALLTFGALLGSLGGPPAPVLPGQVVPSACAVGQPLPGLSPEQAAGAEVVVAVSMADAAGSEQAAEIALMAGYTESRLLNLGPEPGDDGSLGIFQQRSSEGWGTTAEEEDPADATTMFMARLLAIPGWEVMAPWAAAQAVQGSAFADGSNYAANWKLAGTVFSSVLAAEETAGCGDGAAGGLAGAATSDGLPVGYLLPTGTPPEHAAAVAYALAQLGKPYVWGAAGPGPSTARGSPWRPGPRLGCLSGTTRSTSSTRANRSTRPWRPPATWCSSRVRTPRGRGSPATSASTSATA